MSLISPFLQRFFTPPLRVFSRTPILGLNFMKNRTSAIPRRGKKAPSKKRKSSEAARGRAGPHGPTPKPAPFRSKLHSNAHPPLITVHHDIVTPSNTKLRLTATLLAPPRCVTNTLEKPAQHALYCIMTLSRQRHVNVTSVLSLQEHFKAPLATAVAACV